MEAIGCPHFDFGDPPNGFNTFIIKQGAYERSEQLVEKKMVTVTIAKQGFSNVNHHLMTAKLKTVQGSVHKKRHSYAGVACPASRPAPCTEPSHLMLISLADRVSGYFRFAVRMPPVSLSGCTEIRNAFLSILQTNIATVLSKENDQTLADIDFRLEELQTQLLKLASSKADYEDVAEEIHQLREKKQNALVENANRDEVSKRIADMSAFLQEQPTAITDYDEQLIRRLIEKVTVYEGKFTVEFKSGVTVDVEE